MGTRQPSYRLPVNVGFVALAARDERPDVVSYLDLDTGGVFTLLIGDDGEPLAEGLDCRLLHHLEEHPERFVTIDPLTVHEKETFITEFLGGLTDEYLKLRLRKAAEAQAAFDACEEVLRSYPGVWGRWEEHLTRFLLGAALELLGENLIEPQLTPRDKELQLL